ncbi:MAG: hypothetical protein JNM63_09825 [Spirochaetia bacterium]|nr:hypothetical protein [Spirochaetia bacterium]
MRSPRRVKASRITRAFYWSGLALLIAGCYQVSRSNPNDPLSKSYAVHFQKKNEFALPDTWGYHDLVADSNSVYLRTTPKSTAHLLRFDLSGNKLYDVDAGYTDGKFVRYTSAAGGVLACSINDSQIETLTAASGSPLSTSVSLTNTSGATCKISDYLIETSGNLQIVSANTHELLRYGGAYNVLWGSVGILLPGGLALFRTNETAVLCETGLKRPHLRRYQWTNGALLENVTNIGVMSGGSDTFLYPEKMKSDGNRLYFSIVYDNQGLSLFRTDGTNTAPVHLSPEVGLFHGFTFTLRGDLILMRTNGGGGGAIFIYEKKD